MKEYWSTFNLTFGLGTVSSRTGVRLGLRFYLIEQRLPEPGEVQGEVVVLTPGGLGQVGQELAQLRCEGGVLKVLIQYPRLGCAGCVRTIHICHKNKLIDGVKLIDDLTAVNKSVSVKLVS